MTREEEIRQAADKYVDNFGCKKKDTPVLSSYYLGYVAGAEWADAHQLSPWVSVAERLPEKEVGYFSQWVLCRYKRGSRIYYHVGMYDYEFEEWSIANVTHWMPIPEL